MQVSSGSDLAGHARSVRSAADSLDQNAPQLASLARGAAERVEQFSRDIRGQTVEDLVRTASEFTRRQPALVFGLASLAGFLAFRVLKSSPPGGEFRVPRAASGRRPSWRSQPRTLRPAGGTIPWHLTTCRTRASRGP